MYQLHTYISNTPILNCIAKRYIHKYTVRVNEDRLKELSLKIDTNTTTPGEEAEFIELYLQFLKKTYEGIQIEDIKNTLKEI